MGDKFIGTARHKPVGDSSRMNRAVERAAKDPSFVKDSVGLLRDLPFPAFKHAIVSYAKRVGAPDDVVALFDSLDGYIEYRNHYHLQKAIGENVSSDKAEYQITDETRTEPQVRTRPTNAAASIKEREAVNQNEEREDYPEVTPTAMSNFICDRCGKPFQNQQDLLRHREFESGSSVT